MSPESLIFGAGLGRREAQRRYEAVTISRTVTQRKLRGAVTHYLVESIINSS